MHLEGGAGGEQTVGEGGPEERADPATRLVAEHDVLDAFGGEEATWLVAFARGNR